MTSNHKDYLSSRVTLNMGPSHPATHGTLRFTMELEGEKIIKYSTEKKWVYYAESGGMSKQNANELIDKVLKEFKKLKLPYTYTETVQYNLATRRLITFNFFNEYKQPVGMDMDIDGLAGSDTEGAGWQITVRVSKKISAL